MKACLIPALFTALLAQPGAQSQTFTPDNDGFIRNWLVLAPIAVMEDSGASEIEKDFLGGEATIKPATSSSTFSKRSGPNEARMSRRTPSPT